jgi:2'-5' RNA ligase
MAAAVPSVRRLFIGLMPDAVVQAALQDHARCWAWPPESRLTRPERLHLTLHFLGDVEAADEQALYPALAAVRMEPLALVLRTPLVFSGGVAVLLPEENAGLRALHGRFAPALARIGYEMPKSWVPHVTLARRAAQAAPPEACPPIRWTVREFALVWSRLGAQSRYEVIARQVADGHA